MNYLHSMLGITIKMKKWEKEKSLPYYLSDRYQVKRVWLDEVCTLFLYPKTNLELIPTLKKHIRKIQELEYLPVVLILKNISRQRCQYLLDSKIPFVVEEKQIYLPFMGVALQQKYDIEQAAPVKLQPSAQMLLLHYIYKNKQKLYSRDAVENLGVSAMTISRAARQLEQTGLFYTKKDGVNKILVAKHQGRELFQQIMPWLINPVRRTVYIASESAGSRMIKAGYTALAEKTMLNPSATASYAIESTEVQGLKYASAIFDSEQQVQLQLWKYDPHCLSENGCVDVLSLALSLSDTNDERVEEAVEEMLDRLWEELDGSRI